MLFDAGPRPAAVLDWLPFYTSKHLVQNVPRQKGDIR